MDSKGNETSLPRVDRDLLIAVSTKQDRMAQDINEIKNGLVERIAKVEARLDAVDVYHARIPLARYDNIATWAENYRANIKFIFLMAGLFLVIVGGLITDLINRFFHF